MIKIVYNLGVFIDHHNGVLYGLFSGVADDMSAVYGQQWTETETA